MILAWQIWRRYSSKRNSRLSSFWNKMMFYPIRILKRIWEIQTSIVTTPVFQRNSWAKADLTNIWYAIMLWNLEGINQFLSNSLRGIMIPCSQPWKDLSARVFIFLILIIMQSFRGLVNTLKLEVKVFFYSKRKLFTRDSNTTVVFIFPKPQRIETIICNTSVFKLKYQG